MIKFSIITVCLNAGNDLLETVESTLKQSYSEFEIIVKDGFSKDESICKLPQDKRIHLVQKKDTGIYDAMNQGIEVAQGDYMIFMNAGDKFYDSEVLKRIADGIEETSGDLYYGRCYNQILDVVDPAPKKLTKYFCYRSMICHQATIYKTSMLKKRGYDVSYTVSADRERMLYAVIKEKMCLPSGCCCCFPRRRILYNGQSKETVGKREKTTDKSVFFINRALEIWNPA